MRHFFRRGGRVVEGARLEILCTPCGYRGFKSLPLRQFIENLNIRDVEVFLFFPRVSLEICKGVGTMRFGCCFLMALLAQVGLAVPTYLCQKAGMPIVIDGQLDEAAWQAAKPSTRPITAASCPWFLPIFIAAWRTEFTPSSSAPPSKAMGNFWTRMLAMKAELTKPS